MPVFDIYDDRAPRRVDIDAKRITIGRTSDNTLYIDDRQASRNHCEVRLSEIGYIIRDLKSRNGTKLNQTLIDRPMSLRDGDEIAIGKATLRFWSALSKIKEDAAELPVVKAGDLPRAGVQPIAPSGKGDTPTTPPKNVTPSKPVNYENPQPRSGAVPAAAPALQRPPAKPVPPQAPARPAATNPAVAKTVPAKPAAPAHPAQVAKPAHPAKPASPAKPAPPPPADEPEPLEIDLELEEVAPEVVVLAPGPRNQGPLTIDHIIPLNHEMRPAHPTGKNAEISEAMREFKQILLSSLQFAATDIHIEPKEEQYQLRYRIDGYLHASGSLETNMARPVFSIVKLLCNLDINKRNVMQDGSFAIQLPDRRIDLRVSIAPSTLGDKMVLRILDKNLAPSGLDTIGMEPYILEQVRQRVRQESCMLITCGPTGSGKTTTVYAILREMNAKHENIVTVEDPVEYKLENVTQIQVDNKREITFAGALKSLLRQDPDVILIGEMRDPETAHMAVQSAMTGHLVLSTIHARDSIGAIFRMLDLGVEPFLLGSALSAILSQRLMRKLCPRCKMRYKPAMRDLNSLGLENLGGVEMFSPVGCDDCMGIGYRGRQAIYELLNINDQVRDAISQKPTIQQLRVAAGDWIFQTLREDALRKLKTGITSLDEFASIASRE